MKRAALVLVLSLPLALNACGTGWQGKAWLLFSVAGGAIGNIQGGNIQICE